LATSTLRLQDLPPVITKAAEEGVTAAGALRNHYLSENEIASDSDAISWTESRLEKLAASAKEACNIRDYVTLLTEQTMLRLALDAGPPPSSILDLARTVNPFLDRQSDDTAVVAGPSRPSKGSASHGEHGLPPPFRATDTALITEIEKDLLVLLYYCDLANLKASPDECVGHVDKMAQKHGTIKDLDLRKESFKETEVSR
jgi:hypothetical protein